MKRVVISLFAVLFLISFVSAVQVIEICDPSVTLINQEPYPAIPGDYVKVVFQIDGVTNPSCGQVTAEYITEYPFSLDPNMSNKVSLKAGTFISQDYQSYFLAPFELRVDKDALDKAYTVKLKVGTGNRKVEEFRSNITVKDNRADFEVSIKDYTASTNQIVFEILNIAKYDVEALTIDIPKQENIMVKGSNRNILGGLDANEDTTAAFEAIPKDGEIKISISYNDGSGNRRTVEKIANFDSSYFKGRVKDKGSNSSWWYVLIIIIIVAVVYFWRRHRRKDKEHREKMMRR